MNDELGDAPNKVRDVSTPLDMTASGELASGDDLTESGEECIHLCLFADRHTHVVGQGWEQSADVDAALLHRQDERYNRTFYIDHDKIRLRRNLFVAHRVEFRRHE